MANHPKGKIPGSLDVLAAVAPAVPAPASVSEPAPNKKLGLPVTFHHQSSSLSIQLSSDPHEARASELDQIGFTKRAQWIRSCDNGASPFPKRTCKQRSCPSCAARIARRNAERAAAIITTMANPIFTLMEIRSKGYSDLAATIREFRECLAAIRRRACFSGVRAGVGAVETKLTADQTCWLVHAHPTLDVEHIDVQSVAAAWKELTAGRGKFGLHEDPHLTGVKILKAAIYATKQNSWCPEPGEMPPHLLALLINAIRGKRLWIEWGTKRGDDQ
jgi:hypothetical protein